MTRSQRKQRAVVSQKEWARRARLKKAIADAARDGVCSEEWLRRSSVSVDTQYYYGKEVADFKSFCRDKQIRLPLAPASSKYLRQVDVAMSVYVKTEN